jgi:hypothetical protein
MRRSLLPALLGLGALVQTQPSAALTRYDYPWWRAARRPHRPPVLLLHELRAIITSRRGLGGTCAYNLYLIRGSRYRGVDTYRDRRRRRPAALSTCRRR